MGGACGHKVAGARRPGHPGTAEMAMVFRNQSGLGLAAAAEMSRQRSGMQGAKNRASRGTYCGGYTTIPSKAAVALV